MYGDPANKDQAIDTLKSTSVDLIAQTVQSIDRMKLFRADSEISAAKPVFENTLLEIEGLEAFTRQSFAFTKVGEILTEALFRSLQFVSRATRRTHERPDPHTQVEGVVHDADAFHEKTVKDSELPGRC